jgi:hypothetical protein
VGHAVKLKQQLNASRQARSLTQGGYDSRLLLKLTVHPTLRPEDIQRLPGLQVISQEGKEVQVLFATEKGLAEFQDRLDQISHGQHATRSEILYAIRGIDGWTAEDRLGSALRFYGIPQARDFVVDIELWSLGTPRDQQLMRNRFEQSLNGLEVRILDKLTTPIILYRVTVSYENLNQLLSYRDVREIDLPPRYQLDLHLLHQSLTELPLIQPPPDNSPGVVVLDSGIATGHPLLSEAVGDTQNYLLSKPPEDENGHGTAVAGLALYGYLEDAIRQGVIIPELRLFSGKITDAKAESEPKFVENYVISAVLYFLETYNCRIFNLSFGDLNKPYKGGHVRSLAAVLDWLARTYNVLFTVSTGNFNFSEEQEPIDLRYSYPEYLLTDDARILDPAPALNVLTVGSIARYEVPRIGQQFPGDPSYQPIARQGQPSPFTRSGPGPGGAIKPEVVEFGGNRYLDVRGGNLGLRMELGEFTTNKDFVHGNLFTIVNGSSFAAPRIAHLAGLLLKQYPNASVNLLRALIVAHARHPQETVQLVNNLPDTSEALYRLIGYGLPNSDAAQFSTENHVTLMAEETIGPDQHQFFEIPIPTDFWKGPGRTRRITVALSHTPVVRPSRIGYKLSSLSFKVVQRPTLEEVVRVFRRYGSHEQRETNIGEVGNFEPGSRKRSSGTVQAATWRIYRPSSRLVEIPRLFIVVTHYVEAWARDLIGNEPYALTVVVEDRETNNARLYSQMQAQLRVRGRVSP